MANRNLVFSNLIWRFFERIGAQLVSLIVSLVLARILDPSVYGEIAIVLVITNLLQVFVDGGFGNALIQKNEADERDFSTVFYFNLFLCVGIYWGLFFISPSIASFFGMDNLSSVLRVLGLTVIISGVKNVQQAYVSRNMLFRKFFFSTLCGTLISAVIGISMAFHGYGVWSIVAQYLSNAFIDTLVLWATVKWRPGAFFSFHSLKLLFSYGWKLLVSQLATVTYVNLRQLIIGKAYTSSDLAFYNRGDQIPGLLVNNINTSIDSVLFPALSLSQNSIEAVRSMTKRAIKISSFVLMPLLMGLAMCAKPLILLVLTEKWLPCVPYLQLFCLVYAFYPIHTANLNAIRAMGRSDLYLVLELIKILVGLISIFLSYRYGVFAIAFAYMVTSLIATYVNAFPTKKLIGYSYIEQLRDISPYIGLSLIMGLAIHFLNRIEVCSIILLMLDISVGAILYFGLSYLFKLDSLAYIVDLIRSITKKNGGVNND